MAAHGAVVPPLWLTEVGNGLLVAQRRNRISEGSLEEALAKLSRQPIQVDPDVGARTWTTALSLARWHGLTLSDALYLDLARHRGLPLATLDRQLRRCAGDEGIPLLPA